MHLNKKTSIAVTLTNKIFDEVKEAANYCGISSKAFLGISVYRGIKKCELGTVDIQALKNTHPNFSEDSQKATRKIELSETTNEMVFTYAKKYGVSKKKLVYRFIRETLDELHPLVEYFNAQILQYKAGVPFAAENFPTKIDMLSNGVIHTPSKSFALYLSALGFMKILEDF